MHQTLDQIIAHALNEVTSSLHAIKGKVNVHLAQQQIVNSIAHKHKS